jgi:hypothetical protein
MSFFIIRSARFIRIRRMSLFRRFERSACLACLPTDSAIRKYPNSAGFEKIFEFFAE